MRLFTGHQRDLLNQRWPALHAVKWLMRLILVCC